MTRYAGGRVPTTEPSCLLDDERGATAIEYGLITAGIGVIIVTTVFAIGPLIQQQFQTVQSYLENNQSVP